MTDIDPTRQLLADSRALYVSLNGRMVSLVDEAKALRIQLASLRQVILAMGAAFGEPCALPELPGTRPTLSSMPPRRQGLKQAVFSVLQTANGVPLRPKEVVRLIQEQGHDLSATQSPHAAVNTVMIRLSKQEPPLCLKTRTSEGFSAYVIPKSLAEAADAR